MAMSTQREINSRIPLTEATPAAMDAADVADPTSTMVDPSSATHDTKVAEEAQGNRKASSDVSSRDSTFALEYCCCFLVLLLPPVIC